MRALSDRPRVAVIVAVGALALGGLVAPLPGAAVDALHVAHVTVVGWVMARALRAKELREVEVLPSALVGLTLLRLALEVAFARRLLAGGGVGEVASTLGRWLSGASVGAALGAFALLAVSQLVLVARGAERAAEVSARFALDAMPGRQLAIDADLRAGALGVDAARREREGVLAESRLHGAMDGALRFVKGDAVVGLVAAGVNVLGGVVAGVLRDGSSAADAFARYGALAVGQGVAVRVPALVMAATAAAVLTRVRWGEDAAGAEGQCERELGLDETRALLDALGAPVTVRTAVASPADLVLVCDVLRLLQREGVSLAGLREVLEVLARRRAEERDAVGLLPRVREALSAWLTKRYAPEGAVSAWRVEPVMEDALRDHVGHRASERVAGDLVSDLVAAVRAAVESETGIVIVTDGAVRWHLREALVGAFPDVVVLAATELEPRVVVKSLGVIRAV